MNNLTKWMAATPSLDTLKKVATASDVGFGTVQRFANGESNLTRKSLEKIAGAFDKTVEDLMRQPCPEPSRVDALINRHNARKHGMTKEEFRAILNQANIIAFAKRMRYDPDEVEKETLRGINVWVKEMLT
jgi:transcriptional regulator with XRE-family HTH domain